MVHLIELSKMMSNSPVQRLAFEHPEWLPVLHAAVSVAARSEAFGGEFSGRSVVTELAARGGPRWINNLRLLVAYGLIEKVDSSARRTYYRMPARPEIERALAETPAPQARKKRLRFIAAGAATDPPADMGRRAGEVEYEPRPWR
jgi:hypothetical protein